MRRKRWRGNEPGTFGGDLAEIPAAVQAIQVSPYSSTTRLVALTVGDMPPECNAEPKALRSYGDKLWGAASRALIWWTPACTEQEALRRAADDPSPSIIAEEVALFTAAYEAYAKIAYNMAGRLPSTFLSWMKMQLSLMRSTLEGLERRAQAAEARATDYRLRYEFDALRKVVAARDAASKIAELLAKAVASTESIEHLHAVQGEVAGAVAEVRKALDGMTFDVEYTAGLVREEVVRRQLPMERLKAALAGLANVGGAGALVTQVAGVVLRLFS